MHRLESHPSNYKMVPTLFRMEDFNYYHERTTYYLHMARLLVIVHSPLNCHVYRHFFVLNQLPD